MRLADGAPVAFLAESEEPVDLHRISPRDPSLAEDQIQRLVFDHPRVLPIQELDDSFVPAVPIGREIGTQVGPIDVLYVSPSGGVTIIEAKLWRNPEARREVVGQIIDYAAAMSSWSYEDLDRVCRLATGSSLWALVSSRAPDDVGLGEAGFIDAVSRNLRYGRFLLLVVGDGIREEVERMVSYVQTAPRMQFHLALVELRMYASGDGRIRAVVPSVVARTAEITRAVVHVDVAEEARVDVEVRVPADDSPRSRRKLTMDQFFSEMRDRATPAAVRLIRNALEDFERDPRFHLLPGAASVSLRLRPEAGGDFTILVFETSGRVYPGWLSSQCRRVGIPEHVAVRFVADLSRIFDIPVHKKLVDSLSSAAEPEAVEEHWDSVSARIDELVQEIHALLE